MKKFFLTVTIILASIIFIIFIIFLVLLASTIVGPDYGPNYVDDVGVGFEKNEQLTAEFDGNTKLSGSQVIAAIRTYYTNKALIIVQENGRNYSINASKAVENYTGGTPPYSTTQAAIGQDSTNIKIAETYSSKLIYSGKRIVGIQFIQNP